MSKKLTTKVIQASHIEPPLIDEMYRLYANYYDETNQPLFNRDLSQKDYVLLLFDKQENLRGFTTLEILTTTFSAQPVKVIFSGDTIIHHHFWGEQTLPLAWCHLAGQIKALSPQLPLFWFLIVKGHRTYRYLNIFSKTYYPHRKQPTPPEIKTFMDSLAKQKFGKDYCTDTGTVRYTQSHGHLKPEWANETIKKSPEANFFYEKNPNADKGHELVCLTELSEKNLRSFALRGFCEGVKDETTIG
ncbi:MAG: hypothetical protein KGV56_03225 [Gammaproteobacteria bacterium]|nr:hypothetical protein [Gammaproteobacteria bacterium]